MFETLDDHMKHDRDMESTKAERFLRWAFALIATVVVLGGLYLGVKLLE
jgi:hypothetical protein